MSEHIVTVAFDDEKSSIDAVVRALNDSGYTVPRYEQAE